MPKGPFSLCLRALSFMPTGPSFYAYGPFSFVTVLCAVLTVSLMICYPLLSRITAWHLVPSKFLYAARTDNQVMRSSLRPSASKIEDVRLNLQHLANILLSFMVLGWGMCNIHKALGIWQFYTNFSWLLIIFHWGLTFTLLYLKPLV